MHKISRITFSTLVVFLYLTVLCIGSAAAKEKAKKVAAKEFDFAKTSVFIREMETRPDFPVSVGLANDYVYSLQAIGEPIAPARKKAIVAYIKSMQQKDGGFVADKAEKSASALFTDISLETLGYLNATGSVDLSRVKSFVGSLKRPDGGFSFSPADKGSSLASTYNSLRVLRRIKGLDVVDKAKTAQYIAQFERPSGGFNFVKGVGVADPQSTYTAVFSLNTLGMLKKATGKDAIKFLANTQYNNKSNKQLKDLNQQWNAIMALKELKAADKIDKKMATEFLKKIYIAQNGGFGPLEGYGSTPASTATGLRILSEMGRLKAPSQVAKK
jgi:prenyltransferase beta subunit